MCFCHHSTFLVFGSLHYAYLINVIYAIYTVYKFLYSLGLNFFLMSDFRNFVCASEYWFSCSALLIYRPTLSSKHFHLCFILAIGYVGLLGIHVHVYVPISSNTYLISSFCGFCVTQRHLLHISMRQEQRIVSTWCVFRALFIFAGYSMFIDIGLHVCGLHIYVSISTMYLLQIHHK